VLVMILVVIEVKVEIEIEIEVELEFVVEFVGVLPDSEKGQQSGLSPIQPTIGTLNTAVTCGPMRNENAAVAQ